MDFVRKEKEKDRDGHEHEAEEQVHDFGTHFGGKKIDEAGDDGGRDQEREHDAPPDRVPVFCRDIKGADADHCDGDAHSFTVYHDQRQKPHCDHGGAETQRALDS